MNWQTLFVGSAGDILVTDAELREAGVRFNARSGLTPRKNAEIMQDFLSHYVNDAWLAT